MNERIYRQNNDNSNSSSQTTSFFTRKTEDEEPQYSDASSQWTPEQRDARDVKTFLLSGVIPKTVTGVTFEDADKLAKRGIISPEQKQELIAKIEEAQLDKEIAIQHPAVKLALAAKAATWSLLLIKKELLDF